MDATQKGIIDRGLVAQRKTIEGIFEFAACVGELKSTSINSAEFSTMVKKEWGISAGQVSKWIAINDNAEMLLELETPPPSMGTLYQLTTLTEEQWEDIDVVQGLTVADVLKVKKKDDAPKSAGRADGASTKAEPDDGSHHGTDEPKASDDVDDDDLGPSPSEEAAYERASKAEEEAQAANERAERAEAKAEAIGTDEVAAIANLLTKHPELIANVWKSLIYNSHPDKGGDHDLNITVTDLAESFGYNTRTEAA